MLGLGALGACYRPQREADCAVRCEPLSETPLCPDSLACGTDGMCFAGAQQCNERPDRPDAGVAADAFVNADGMTCYGGGLFTYCIDPTASVPATASPGGAFDTDGCAITVPQNNGPTVCVIVATDITVTSTLTARGAHPLVLVATRDLTVSADINVSAGGAGGAGAATALCNQQAAAAGQASITAAAAGGSGGSRGGTGGAGGGIDSGSQTARQNPVMSTVVSAGCAGGAGGDDDNDTGGGEGGRGGGAIYLIAGHQITVGAHVHANGEGGAAGKSQNAGGGGGGSGGLIGLDAPTILLSSAAVLHAAGGGGGGGAATDPTGQAQAGHDPVPGAPNLPAKGGLGGVATSTGGDGSSGANLDGSAGGNGMPGNESTAKGSGGGGGGGSAGVIKFHGAPTILAGAKAVPSPT